MNFNFGLKVLTDRNKRNEMLLCVNVYSVMICRAVSSYLFSSLNILLASDKFDTFSSNFYQHQAILARQKRCNLLIDRARCCWLRSNTVAV